ncbi:MAG: Trp biosynthesis-associated membrane protein [Microbacteriaceae bacterium]
MSELSAEQARSAKKLKGITLLLLIVMLLVLSASLAPVWVTAHLQPDAAIDTKYVQSGGSHFVFVSLALAIAASIVALSLSGLVVRYLLAIVLFALSSGMFLNTLNVIRIPFDFVAEELAKLTGIRGPGLNALILSIESSFWPWLTLIASTMGALLALFLLFSTNRWPAQSKKYSRESETDDYQTGWGKFELDDEES